MGPVFKLASFISLFEKRESIWDFTSLRDGLSQYCLENSVSYFLFPFTSLALFMESCSSYDFNSTFTSYCVPFDILLHIVLNKTHQNCYPH